MVAAAIRTIFAQPTGAEVIEQLDKVAAMLAPKFPAVATMLVDAGEDLTAFAVFPVAHWTRSGLPTRWSASTRGQAPHQRGRDLPRRRGRAAAGRGGAARGS
jgi:putative transposase